MNRQKQTRRAGKQTREILLSALSFDELKQQATSFVDINEWFKHNLSTLGIAAPADLEDVSVNIMSDIESLLESGNTVAPSLKATLEVGVYHDVKPAPLVKTDLLLSGYVESRTSTKMHIQFPLDDWPFITVRLAVDDLNDEVPCKPEHLCKIEPLLTKYLPLHFPGYTWENLQALCASNVLPTDSQDFLDGDAIMKMMFASRIKREPAVLPENLSL